LKHSARFLLFAITAILLSCNNSGGGIKVTTQAESTFTYPVDSLTKHPDTWIYDTLVKRNHSSYEERTIEIEKNIRLSDSVFYVLYSVGTPVNIIRYILPYVNNRPQEDVMISEGPDADLSIPFYDYTEYMSDNDTIYYVIHYDEQVKYPEKVLDKDGHFKDGFNFENVDIKTDTTHTRIRINRNGIILHDTLK